ncbi:MAG: glycosyltransferase [Clostridiales bacterium]|nr:glycosyltransferase [Clostridiales bacterium]
MAKETDRRLRILMMIHRQADNSPYCFYVHEQAKALRALGHDVTVIACVGVMPMMERLRPAQAAVARETPEQAVVDGIPVYYPRALTLGNVGERLLGGRLLARAALPVARRLHREKPFDLVHAHMLPRDGHAGLLVARALGVPMALTVHGTDVLHYFEPGKTPWARNRRIAQEADALMAVSTLLLSRVAPWRGEGKITRVVPNGVDLSLVPEQTRTTPRAVISVGTLKARKCMDRTLEAFARLAGEYTDATLTIVGIGEMEGALRARIAELRLEERVTLTGGLPHEQVLARMAESDLFVLPSWGEGYGIVYIEAMAAGCIAVGAQGEGIEDTIRDGENGFLVPAGDTDAVCRVMRDVFAHRERYDALRERGRQAACALTWARNAETAEAIYQEMLNNWRQKHGQKGH